MTTFTLDDLRTTGMRLQSLLSLLSPEAGQAIAPYETMEDDHRAATAELMQDLIATILHMARQLATPVAAAAATERDTSTPATMPTATPNARRGRRIITPQPTSHAFDLHSALASAYSALEVVAWPGDRHDVEARMSAREPWRNAVLVQGVWDELGTAIAAAQEMGMDKAKPVMSRAGRWVRGSEDLGAVEVPASA